MDKVTRIYCHGWPWDEAQGHSPIFYIAHGLMLSATLFGLFILLRSRRRNAKQLTREVERASQMLIGHQRRQHDPSGRGVL